MKRHSYLVTLALGLVPAVVPAAPTRVPVSWESRSPASFDFQMGMFGGALTALSTDGNGSPGGIWSSPDTGRIWSAPQSGDLYTGLQSVRIGAEDVLFLIQPVEGASSHRLVRKDRQGASVVLDSTSMNFWYAPIVNVGNVLLLPTMAGLKRSTDGGKTWNSDGQEIVRRYPYGGLEPMVLAGAGKRLVVMAAESKAMFTSTDTGRIWKTIATDFTVPAARNGGAMDTTTQSLFLPVSNGAPVRLRFSGDSWVLDTLLDGWPLDSLACPAISRSVVFLRDTIWATTGKNLFFWKPKQSTWERVPLAFPAFGDQVAMDAISGELWFFAGDWVARRAQGGHLAVLTPPDAKVSLPRLALAWHRDALFTCGWTGCTMSKDSGKTWEPANRGLETDFVVQLKSTSGGLLAATYSFGLRLWNGTYWQDAGMAGIDRNATSGRYGMIPRVESIDDTLAFSWSWGKGIWMRKGKQAGWSLVEHGAGGAIAWADGAYWTRSGMDTLETSRSGAVWSTVQSPFRGTLHGVDGKLVITQEYGRQLAWKQGDSFRKDTLVGTFGSYGSFVASHPSGVLAMNSSGVYLLTKEGDYELVVNGDSYTAWISSLLLVGNRLFIARISGLWTTTLPAPIQVALQPRDRRGWGLRNASRGLTLELAKPAHVEFSWYDLSGARRGGIDKVLDAGTHSLVVPSNSRGAKIVRVSVEGVLSESRVLVMP